MDDEDKEDMGTQIRTALAFDVVGSAQKELMRQRAIRDAQNTSAFFSSTIFNDIISPEIESIGVQLLKKMGQVETRPSFTFQAKKDMYGLGFDPIVHHPELKLSALSTKDKPKHHGFGLGVFEGNEDDIDVYEEVASDRYVTILEEEEAPTPLEPTGKPTVGFTGFKKSRRPLVQSKSYPAPPVPVDYVATIPFQPRPSSQVTQLEQPVIVKPVSEPVAEKPVQLVATQIPKEAAEAALKGYKPFSNDPDKQERYTRFLKVQLGQEKDLIVPKVVDLM